jgi:hypothetical protein
MKFRSAVEMTGRMEKARKTNNRFPSLSHRALGNRCRDSHIPTAPVTVFPVLKTKNERSPWLPAFICSVQAHSSMRKCFSRLGTLLNEPRRILFSVISPNHRSTWFTQEPLVGVKCRWYVSGWSTASKGYGYYETASGIRR